MRIGIDLSRYFDRSGGVGIYAANLLKYLLKIDKNNEYNAYSFFYNCFPSNWKHKKIIDEFRKYGKVNFSQINLPTSILKRKWNNSSIEKKEKLLGGVDIIHSTAYMIPELFNARLVVTIHDLSFLIFPEYHTKENYELVLSNLIYLNSRPDMVICDSLQTKKDVIKYFHVPEEKLRVVYLGVSDSFREEIDSDFRKKILEKYGLTGKYLLCVASIEPRKNFLRIINAFSEFIKQEEYKEYSLVCVGGRGWKNIEIYSLVKQKNLEGKIKFLGFIEESELAPIYNQAEIFLYPSLYEGFGLPVLEAMACAVPVITSNVSSLPEVASDAAILVNPYSEKDIYTAVCSLLENGSLRKKLISKGLDRVREFSWEKTARETLKVYHGVYNL
ncbi:MAG: glycosyltransferase family 4 protein [Actinobacteria bacterium]|nr:glycosyltransferase family 4 protein [Chloroflexota bacterium]MBE3129007.1 glycosyltransferase family 4 protein [Actinomycetota bacterium]